jgi:hypothetical protein
MFVCARVTPVQDHCMCLRHFSVAARVHAGKGCLFGARRLPLLLPGLRFAPALSLDAHCRSEVGPHCTAQSLTLGKLSRVETLSRYSDFVGK